MTGIRPATREDLDALASLRPYVHDRHATAHPENFKVATHEAARREAEGWLDVYHFNAGARAFFIAQGFEPQRERLSRLVR